MLLNQRRLLKELLNHLRKVLPIPVPILTAAPRVGGGGSDSNEATAGSSSDQIASIEEVKATANASDDSDNDNMESNEEDSSSRPKWWLHMQRAQPSKLRLAAPAGRCAGYQWMVRQLWQHQRIPRKRSRRSHKQPLLLASVLMAPTPVPLKKHQRSTWR